VNNIRFGMILKAVVGFLAPAVVVVAGAVVQARGHLELVDWSATWALALTAALTSGVAVFAVPNKTAVSYEPDQADFDADDEGAVGANVPDAPAPSDSDESAGL
jgi:hypothetical protein